MKNGELGVVLACTALVAMVLFFVAGWTGAHTLAVLSKPIPALVLAALALTARRDWIGRLIGAGLLFGALGDLLLALGEHLFIAGLLAFLVDHLLVSGAFFAEESRLRPGRAAPFLVFGVAMLATLGPKLGAMAVPVGTYTGVIGLMMWRAAARVSGSNPSLRSIAGLIGAVVFALSDAMIAIDTFHTDIYDRGEAVMVTYWLAQSLIVASILPRRAA